MSIKDYTPGAEDPQFWYNLRTGAVEEGQQDVATHLWGPFATRDEAEHAMEKAKQRNEDWDNSWKD